VTGLRWSSEIEDRSRVRRDEPETPVRTMAVDEVSIGIHGLSLVGDSYLHPSLLDASVPFVSGYSLRAFPAGAGTMQWAPVGSRA
jgi:hypothetical protein